MESHAEGLMWLSTAVESVASRLPVFLRSDPIDGRAWGTAPYQPTPTILEAVIQNVHHFRDDGIRDPSAAPFDHVVIFDEAQRAWDRKKTADFMKRRKRIPDFNQSEPAFLISYLNRHDTWAVIICLVGGGQEIHTGEVGIAEWLDAVRLTFDHWHVYIPPDVAGSEYAARAALGALGEVDRVVRDQRLHLPTSMRSFRSEHVSEFVRATLDCEVDRARELLRDVSRRYPIAITRDLGRAKRWVRAHARGSERYGLVASSQAQRLKPHAIDVRVAIDPVQWFLNDRLDWICVPSRPTCGTSTES
jgi:hypothetical protein